MFSLKILYYYKLVVFFTAPNLDKTALALVKQSKKITLMLVI